MAAETVVAFENVSRIHRVASGEVRALRDVTVSMPPGIVAIVGPSGSGKSSMLRLIAGMDRPTSGSVVVKGHEIARAPARETRRLRRETVRYVFQQPAANFFADLTVGEHLRLAAGPAADPIRLAAILDALGLGHRTRHLPSQLSGGEQQRAAFAQALASGAGVVVADEPTAELDSASAALVLDRLRGLAGDGVTFVIATHDADVIGIADHRVELEHGRLRTSTAHHVAAPELASITPGAPIRWPEDPDRLWIAGDDAPAVRLEGVWKRFGEGAEVVEALRGVSLTAAPGEIVEVVGRSGSGKTTLLNVAAGWLQPDAGEVVAPGARRPSWSDIAVLPQRLGLMEELTVSENVEYPARLAGRLPERRELVEDLLEALGLSALQGRHPKEISLGEQQRTALARALVLSPGLLVADEPTAHQDAASARAMLDVMAGAAAGGTCCLIATHDASIGSHAHRTVSMSDGEVV